MAAKKLKVNPPRSHDDWHALLQSAITMAEKSNDRRVQGLKQAMVSGNVEKHLRKLGIISVEDLTREFNKEES